jgi:galactose mutarotase-like enzyme
MTESTELAVGPAAASQQPPSGQQHVLVAGRHQAVVVEVGGGVRSYTLGGRPVLDGYGEEAMATAARGQPLLPWPNRVRDGRYCWDGVEHQLALTEPATDNALHGLVRWTNWTATRKTSTSVTMQHVLRPQPGYPFALELTITYNLGSEGLTVTTRARNVGSGSAPYAGGQHPYLATSRQVDDCHLHSRTPATCRRTNVAFPWDARRPRAVRTTSAPQAYRRRRSRQRLHRLGAGQRRQVLGHVDHDERRRHPAVGRQRLSLHPAVHSRLRP